MNELQVVVNQTPGVIEWNFEELKANLTEQLAIYKTTVYDDESISAAKSDVAALRKLRKSVEDKRKEVKEKCLEPYSVIEKQAKELVGIIDEPIAYVNSRVEQYETEQKAIRKAKIGEYLDSSLAGLDETLIANIKAYRYDVHWENKTTAVKDWKAAIDKIVAETRNDISLIHNMDSDFRDQCMSIYCKTLELGRAVEKQNELLKMREAMEEKSRQREEALRRQQEAETAARTAAEQSAQESQEPVRQEEPTAGADPREHRQVQEPQRNVTPPEFVQPTAEPEKECHTIRFYCDGDKLKKILGYAKFVGAEAEELTYTQVYPEVRA